MRSSNFIAAIAITLTTLTLSNGNVAWGQEQPNIVMIISDDQAWTDYSFMGHESIKTPHLDQLARESVVFRRGYVPTALCRPSLMTMITGHYAHHHGITGNDPSPKYATTAELNETQRAALIANVDKNATLPRQLAEAGYLCHQSGKWWEGSFKRGGFTHGMTRGFPEKGGRHGDDGLKIGREGLSAVTDFIDMSIEEKKPFFVWYAPFLPHTPHNPPKRLLKKYSVQGRPVTIAKYYAMCDWFDETCGQLLNHLDKANVRDNTLIVTLVITDGFKAQTLGDTPRDQNKLPTKVASEPPSCSRGQPKLSPPSERNCAAPLIWRPPFWQLPNFLRTPPCRASTCFQI